MSMSCTIVITESSKEETELRREFDHSDKTQNSTITQNSDKSQNSDETQSSDKTQNLNETQSLNGIQISNGTQNSDKKEYSDKSQSSNIRVLSPVWIVEKFNTRSAEVQFGISILLLFICISFFALFIYGLQCLLNILVK